MKFIYINVLLLMLIPSIILMYLIITKQSTLNKYFSDEVLNKLNVSNQYFSNKARNITMFLALIFFIIALARPVTNEKQHQITNEKTIPLVIALDVSKSMLANDIYPTRLDFAKKKLLEIIDYSKQNSIAVILFAKSSYVLSPLTTDFNSLKILINNLDTGVNFDNGTNILSVIESTSKLTKNFENRNLLILTDGGDNLSFEKEINLAKQSNTKVYTLALATKKGSAVRLNDGNYLTDKKGNIVNLKLNENIKNLSLDTKAGYINYTLDNSDFKQILNDINSKSNELIQTNKKMKSYTELFYYPLALGVIFLLIANSSMPSFKKKTSTSLFIICLTFFGLNTKSYALEFDFEIIKEANQNYKNQDYDNAIKNYEKLESSSQSEYNLANAYYKNKQYKKAAKLYENIKTDDRDLDFQRLHNLGNSYAKAGEINKAIKAYENSLKIKEDKLTKENLELLKKLKDKKNQKKSKKPENKKDKKDKKNKNKKSEENKSNKESSNKKQKEEIMTKYEEEKWLKQLENKKTNSLLKKMKSSKQDSSSNPW